MDNPFFYMFFGMIGFMILAIISMAFDINLIILLILVGGVIYYFIKKYS